MANRLINWTETGKNIYAIVKRNGQVWNGSALENYTNANISNYDVIMAESAAGSYQYAFTFPTAITTAGDYQVDIYRQLSSTAGTPALNDVKIDGFSFLWDGAAEIPLSSLSANITSLLGQSFTISSPIANSGTLTFVQGDDFPAGNELTFTISSYAGASLAGGTATLYLQSNATYQTNSNVYALTKTGTITVAGSTITAKFVIASSDTAALAGAYVYQVCGITSGSKVITLALGSATIKHNCGRSAT